MQVKRRCHTRVQRLLTILASLLLVGLSHVHGGTILLPATAGEVQRFVAQAPATQDADPNKSTGEGSVTRGMEKEAVRTMWGNPTEIRKIRTCFGWQEEWVYRGNQKRFGANERVLLFDEGEVLTEIK